MKLDILKYESIVWKTADLLIGAGIKQSDFPKYMMPFFALIMVESRFSRMGDELKEELKKSGDELSIEEFIDEIKDSEKGYNTYLFEHDKTLSDICQNDKTFEIDFDNYLRGFDDETQDLLGIHKSTGEDKYLDISSIAGLLNNKKILFAFVKAWSEIDLKPFDNSEITTLEEHIKRKWADISADTAGEQYTPDDVISLISDIILSKTKNSDKFLTIYDPTCGGGNMLYGVEDRVNSIYPNRPTATYGQDWNDALYALAKIESRFRDNACISYGNTLVSSDFWDKDFDVVVANPPYGVDWKGFQSDIINDKTGRFHHLPAVSDGQFLFMQHLISKMSLEGMGVVVHNGSTLFSGDAGSGESNIRKWMFDSDIVEAIIQLPTDEFFNTGIFTYLWVLNKNKKQEHKNKVIMINASEKFTPMKKNKGKKRKKVDELNRIDIVKTLVNFKDNDYAKVFDKEFFYFNKQALMLTNLDYQGNHIELEEDKKSIKLNAFRLNQSGLNIETSPTTTKVEFEMNLGEIYNITLEDIKSDIKIINDKKNIDLKVYVNGSYHQYYFYDEDKETIINEKGDELGCGKIAIKAIHKKARKKTKNNEAKKAHTLVYAELILDTQKDYEIVPFDKNEDKNKKNIDDFMTKYITKPFILLDNIVGAEINFNKMFYKPQKLRGLETILLDIKNINNELQTLENNLGL